MLPHWQSTPLSDEQLTRLVAEIERNPQYGRPLCAVQDASWSSRDLGIGQQQDRSFDAVAVESSPSSGPNMARKIVAEQMDQQTQTDAFRFVGSDDRIEVKLSQPLRWINLAGVRRTFYHFQLYGAFWLLCQERGPRRGTIQADMMGLGKTTTAYLYILFNCLLADIATHRRRYPHQHNEADDEGPCPSQSQWPIQCSCVCGGVAHRRNLFPVHGPTLIFAPTSLLATWDQEWRLMGVAKHIPARVHIHHHEFAEERRVPLHQRHHLKLTPSRSGLELDSTTSHQFIVVTTIESYLEQIVRLFANLNGRSGSVNIAGVMLPRSHDGIAWARIVRDEAHLTINYDTQFFRIMESFIARPYLPPNFLALTATPMLRRGVADMLALVKTINGLSPTLGDDPRYSEFTNPTALEQLCRDQKALRTCQLGDTAKKLDGLQQRLADSTGRLHTLYCIRRRNSSVQNGKPLALIPPIAYLDVTCPTPSETSILRLQRVEWLLKKQLTPRFREMKMAWTQKHPGRAMEHIELENFLDNASMPRILATLPSLSESPDRGSFTWDMIAQRQWHLEPEGSDFAINFRFHFEGSGKLQQLKAIAEALGSDVNGCAEKLVIVSEFPVVCLAALVVVRSLGMAAEWMHSETDATEREALASNFQGGRDLKPGEVDCRVLVGSTRILGQGITLHRAFRLVLMEPSRHAAVEAQVSKRIHRIGSLADKCWIYRLINPESRIESMLLLDHKHQLHNEYLAGALREVGNMSDLDDQRWIMDPGEDVEENDAVPLSEL